MQSALRKLYMLLIGFLLMASAIAEDEAAPAHINYVEMKPSIVSNLTGGPKYIRCDIQLMTEQDDAVPEIQLHMPAIRHAILMLIAGEDGKVLKTPEGKKDLRKKALKSIQATLKELTGEPRVKDLYFTAYYVQ